jgi:hypothetical protein
MDSALIYCRTGKDKQENTVVYYKVLSQNLPEGTGANHMLPQPVPSWESMRVLQNANQAEVRCNIPHAN